MRAGMLGHVWRHAESECLAPGPPTGARLGAEDRGGVRLPREGWPLQ